MEHVTYWKKRKEKKIRFLVNKHTMCTKCHPWMLNKDAFSIHFQGLQLFVLFLSPPPAGIGIGMLCVSTLVCLYYNVIIAWTFYYLGSSFQSPLPWSCDAVANAGLCGNSTTGNGSGRILSPSEIFWKYVCLHLSQLV